MLNRANEKTGLLTAINGDASQQSGCIQSTKGVLKTIHRAVNAPINKIEPLIEAANDKLHYIDPLLYTTMGLGVYDFITNNAAGWQKEYREIADIADMAILPWLFTTFCVTAAYLDRDLNKRSRFNTVIAVSFALINNLHNAISAASFTQDTEFALSLDNTDPNGSTPSDSNIDIYYNILAGALAVGVTLGALCFTEDSIHEYERYGKKAFANFRSKFSDTTKTIFKIIYGVIKPTLFGSQFNGGTINQATIDIKELWLGQSMTDMSADKRTAIFLGGHGAGLLLEFLMLAVDSEPMKEFVERFFIALAGVFFMEEYFTDFAISVYDCMTNLTNHTNSDSMQDSFNEDECMKFGAPIKITAAVAVWTAILAGTVALGVRNHKQKAANQELGRYRTYTENDIIADNEAAAEIFNAKTSSAASDAPPMDAEQYSADIETGNSVPQDEERDNLPEHTEVIRTVNDSRYSKKESSSSDALPVDITPLSSQSSSHNASTEKRSESPLLTQGLYAVSSRKSDGARTTEESLHSEERMTRSSSN